MRLDLIWNDETTMLDLEDGLVTVGGSPDDGIHLPGLPHGLLTLTLKGELASVTAQRSVRIGRSLFPARVPRLVVEGEELKLPNDVVLRRVADPTKRESRKIIGTAFVAQELLAGGLDPLTTRAATLVCVSGFDSGRVYALPFDENVIGRADDATIRVRDRSVSRKQAVLVRRARAYVLEPVTTAMNAAFINGRPLKKPTELLAGDTIEVGQTVLRFEPGECAPGEKTFVEPLSPPPPPPDDPEPMAALTPELPMVAEPVEVVLVESPRRPGAEALLMTAGAALALLGVLLSVLLSR